MLTKENLWQRIKENEGNIFYTVKRKAFTYTMHDSHITIDGRKNSRIKLKDFEIAYDLHPQKPSDIHDFFTPSYIVALFKDERINY